MAGYVVDLWDRKGLYKMLKYILKEEKSLNYNSQNKVKSNLKPISVIFFMKPVQASVLLLMTQKGKRQKKKWDIWHILEQRK